MLHDFITAFVALIVSTSGALAHDARALASSLADLLSPAATSTYVRAPSTAQHIPSLSTAPNLAPARNATPVSTTTIVYQTINQPVIERVVEHGTMLGTSTDTEAVTQGELGAALNDVRSQFGLLAASFGANTFVSTPTFAHSQRIDQLANITLNGVSGLTDDDIPDGITASDYLPLAGGALTGNVAIGTTTSSNPLEVNGSINIATNASIQNGSRAWLQMGTSGTVRFFASDAGAFQWYFNGTNLVTMTGGFLRIGAGSATVPLQISTTSSSGVSGYFEGNVGIGITAPTEMLDVNGNINASGLLINGTPINTSAPANIVTYTAGSFMFSANTTQAVALTRFLGGANTGLATSDIAGYIVPTTGTLSALYVKADANTFTTAATTFTVMKNAVATAMTCQLAATVLTCDDTANTVSVTAGDRISLRVVTASGGSGTISRSNTSVEFKTTTNVFSSQWTTGADGVSISYATTSNKVGIGTTSPYAVLSVWGSDTSASAKAFEIANNASTTIFSVTNDGNATLSGTLTQGSDSRLKGNVTPLASSTLASLLRLVPVSYTRIDQASSSPQFGFIAQDVADVFPELVSISNPTALTPDGTRTLNYIGFIAPIVSAIQDLARTIAGFAESITTNVLTAITGSFHRVNTDELCVEDICVTRDQFQAMAAAINAPSPSPQADDASIRPVIEINGENPARIRVGDAYADLGAIITAPEADKNLGIKTFLDGTLVSDIVIDTSAPATDTIDYVVTSPSGLTSTSTRTVIIEASGATPESTGALPVLDGTPPLAPDYDATTTLSALPASDASVSPTAADATSTAQ